MKDFLQTYINKIGIELNEEQTTSLIKYYEMIVEKNKVMNLTGITEYEEFVVKHFADSLALVKACDLSKVNSIIDVGTGAGFPGVVLKIVFPHIKITLLDSLNKRINFLNEVIAELGLKDIEALHGRAEDFGHDAKFREQYDLCVSRAVANLSTLSEYCVPFVKINGAFISYKSGNCEEESKEAAKAINCLGGKFEKDVKFNLPDSDISRCFVIVRKIRGTGKNYPRKSGIPTKDPIK